MHHHPLLTILAVGFTLALALGWAAKRLGLSPIVGYLIAGFLVGPQSPGFVAETSLTMELAEAGVILLMFGVGIHFDMGDLLALKGISLPGALFQCAVATLCGFVVGELCGLSLSAGLLLGMGLSVASTVVLLRVLTDNNMVDTVHGRVAVGWLLVEDIITVLILVLLPSLALLTGPESRQTAGAWSIIQALLLAFARLTLLWVLVLVIGGKVVPWVLNKVVRTRSQELFTLTVLVAAFATAVAAAVIFQASMALGAFLGGMVVGKSKLSHQAGEDILPFKAAFAVLFFISVGMLLDPGFILEQPLLVAGSIIIVLVVKPLAAMFIVSILGYSARTGLVVGVSLAQIGEFSFILAQLAYSLNIIDMDVYNVLVVSSILSITINPALFRAIPAMESFLKRHPLLWRWMNARADKKARDFADAHIIHEKHAQGENARVIIVGYGPVGKSSAQALTENGVSCCVIDMNVDTINALNDDGHCAVFGNAAKGSILKAAGVDNAQYLILTLPVLEDTLEAATAAVTLNPQIRILARARFLQDRDILRCACVTAIVFEEEQAAVALTEAVMKDLEQCAADACPVYWDTEETGAGHIDSSMHEDRTQHDRVGCSDGR